MPVTVQIITIAGAPSLILGSLSESHLSSLFLSFGEGALGPLRAVSATHHAKLTLCNVFMPTEPSLETMMPVSGRQNSPFGTYS